MNTSKQNRRERSLFTRRLGRCYGKFQMTSCGSGGCWEHEASRNTKMTMIDWMFPRSRVETCTRKSLLLGEKKLPAAEGLYVGWSARGKGVALSGNVAHSSSNGNLIRYFSSLLGLCSWDKELFFALVFYFCAFSSQTLRVLPLHSKSALKCYVIFKRTQPMMELESNRRPYFI